MIEKSNSYVFGPFELIPDRGVLTCNGVALPLGSRAIKILVLLVKRAGQVVSAQELMEYVWPNGAVVESNLRVHLANIRKHLVAATGDVSAILTIPGQGYQFNLRVESHRTTARQRNRSSLPNLWTDLIGREDILNRLSADIEAYRFVSLVGSGGVGKTSVALALGHRAAELYEDGVVFADFTTLSSRSMLVDRLVGILRLPASETPPETMLLEHLSDRKSLLILDNCEHILEAAADLVEQMLRAGPEVHVLTTSREPLLGEGEWVVQLHGLEGPPIDKAALTASEALTYPAARLFAERALASQSWFVLRDEDAPFLARLCHRLGGIPLAIELAAARVDMFDLSTLTGQLDNSLQLLTKGRRTALERHRTLRATLDWSFRLLSEGERLLLSRLAIFQSAFDREAAIAVAGDSVITESRILDGVTSLAAKSLIVTGREGPIPIYRLLESTRQYALEMLGDPSPWGPKHTLFGFLSTSKYPASLEFILMTIGPMFLFWYFTERWSGRLASIVETFGRVPFFFYLLHIPLIHFAACVVSICREGHIDPWLFANHPVAPGPAPDGYRWSLSLLYLVYGLCMFVLYFACLWFVRVKQENKAVWLSYL
jgi:predicted ATPase/DNA-binding winged helix-turn-helix (wHTH) protein